MEINDRVFVRTDDDSEASDPGTVIDFSDGMAVVHFDQTGMIGNYLKAEMVIIDQATILEKLTVEQGGK